jgi:hypothetical protein
MKKAAQTGPRAGSKKAAAPATLSAADLEAADRLIARHTRQSRIAASAEQATRRPFFLRRGPMENVATALIAIGFLMMFQPFALTLYSWSFVTMLAGTLMFVIVSKFPE